MKEEGLVSFLKPGANPPDDEGEPHGDGEKSSLEDEGTMEADGTDTELFVGNEDGVFVGSADGDVVFAGSSIGDGAFDGSAAGDG